MIIAASLKLLCFLETTTNFDLENKFYFVKCKTCLHESLETPILITISRNYRSEFKVGLETDMKTHFGKFQTMSL